MKSKIVPIIAVLAIMVIAFSCEDSTFKKYTGYKPVYMSYEELRQLVSVEEPADLVNPGKIYFKDNYIFIVEEMMGIHIYDNSDPANPLPTSFINLPGVMDLSISGFYLYADSYIDLVVLNIEDPLTVKVETRIENVLPYIVPEPDEDYPATYADRDKGVVIDWILGEVVERVNNNYNIYPHYRSFDSFVTMTQSAPSGNVSGTGVGIGGSMTRFGIREDVLYIVNESTMNIFDISSPTEPVEFDEITPGWGIETMFIYNDKMFLGTTTGMIIYDLAVKFRPTHLSFFRHARSCDPVIVDGDLAYVTLRSGTDCGGTINTLDVVDISSLLDPELLISYPMFNPHGLGKDGDLLFLCDGSEGLKVYNASNPMTIKDNLVYSYPSINAFDVIPLGDILIMIGEEGLAQYDYSDPSAISLLSLISAID